MRWGLLADSVSLNLNRTLTCVMWHYSSKIQLWIYPLWRGYGTIFAIILDIDGQCVSISAYTSEAACVSQRRGGYTHVWAVPHDASDVTRKECLVQADPPECRQAEYSRYGDKKFWKMFSHECDTNYHMFYVWTKFYMISQSFYCNVTKSPIEQKARNNANML